MRSRSAAVRRVLLFAGVPAIGAFSPLIVLPALTTTLGSGGWAALAIAQAVGSFGALLSNWGWNVEGPSAAAGAATPELRGLYSASLRTRTLTAAFAIPLASAIAFAIAPEYRASAAVMAAAVTLTGALPTWYFIGRAQPIRMSCFDAFPRVGAALVASVLLPVLRSDWVYPAASLMITLAALVVAARMLTGRVLHVPGSEDLRILKERRLLVASGLVSSGYTTLAIPLVAVTNSAATAVFAAASRFQGYGTLGLGAVTNAAQGWVSAHGADAVELRHRRVLALIGNSVAGVVGGVSVAVALPLVSRFLFSGTVVVSASVGWLVGGIVLMLAISMSTTYHLLVPAGRTNVVALSGIATSVIGVPALAVLSHLGGADGALAAILIAESVSAGVQLVAYFGSGRRRSASRSALSVA